MRVLANQDGVRWRVPQTLHHPAQACNQRVLPRRRLPPFDHSLGQWLGGFSCAQAVDSPERREALLREENNFSFFRECRVQSSLLTLGWADSHRRVVGGRARNGNMDFFEQE